MKADDFSTAWPEFENIPDERRARMIAATSSVFSASKASEPATRMEVASLGAYVGKSLTDILEVLVWMRLGHEEYRDQAILSARDSVLEIMISLQDLINVPSSESGE